MRYFTAKLLRSWLYVVRLERHRLRMLEHHVSGVMKQRGPFLAWLDLASLKWTRRGVLLRRFVRYLKRLVHNRKCYHESLQLAFQAWTTARMRSVLQVWSMRAKRRASVTLTAKQSIRLFRFRTRHFIRTAFYTLAHSASLSRRVRAGRDAATRHYVFRVALRAIGHWAHYARSEREARFRQVEHLLRVVFQAWVRFVPQTREEKRRSAALWRMQRSRTRRVLTQSLRLWKEVHIKKRRAKHLSKVVGKGHLLSILGKGFHLWRSLWGKALFWRAKELAVDAQESKQLLQLRNEEMLHLERERKNVISQFEELKKNLSDIEFAIKRREEEVYEKEELIQAKSTEKEELEAKLQQARGLLEERRAERERLRSVEKELLGDIEREKDRVKHMEEMAEEVARRNEKEKEALLVELNDAKEHARVAREVMDEQIRVANEQLEKQRLVNESLRSEAAAKEELIGRLEDEKRAIQSEIDDVQHRLKSLTVEGLSLLDDGSAMLRKREAVVRTLRSETGEAEARVLALKEMVKEKKERLALLHAAEIQRTEEQEIEELKAISARENQYLLSSAVANAPFPSNPSPKGLSSKPASPLHTAVHRLAVEPSRSRALSPQSSSSPSAVMPFVMPLPIPTAQPGPVGHSTHSPTMNKPQGRVAAIARQAGHSLPPLPLQPSPAAAASSSSSSPTKASGRALSSPTQHFALAFAETAKDQIASKERVYSPMGSSAR
jgi:hypothetical protein